MNLRNPKQQSSDQNFNNHQGRNVIWSWGRNLRTIYQLPQFRSSKNYAGKNGSQTAPNANTKRQYNRSWRGQHQHCRHKVEFNVHDNQLAAMQISTETIPPILESRTYKPRQLIEQAPCSHTPPHSTANMPNTKNISQPNLTKTPSYGSGNSINNQFFWTRQAETLQQGPDNHNSKH